jgi:putative FmdB family regulatory protein
MPTYQYACTNSECGTRFELLQSFTDPAASECPTCEGPVRKVFSPVGVVFKGSGFYRTDSRAGNGKSSGAKGTDSGKGSGTTSSAGNESTGSSSGSASSSSSSSNGSGSAASTSKAPASV